MAYGSTMDIFYGYRYYRFIMTLFTIVCPVSQEDQGAVFPGVPLFLSILFLEEISPTANGLNIYQTVNQHTQKFRILSYRLNAFPFCSDKIMQFTEFEPRVFEQHVASYHNQTITLFIPSA